MLLTEEGELKSMRPEEVLPIERSPTLFTKCVEEELFPDWRSDLDVDSGDRDGSRMQEMWESYSESTDSTLDLTSETSSERSSKLGQNMYHFIDTKVSPFDGYKSYSRERTRDLNSIRTVSNDLESSKLTSCELDAKKTGEMTGEMHSKEVKSKYLHRQDNCRGSQLSRTKKLFTKEQDNADANPYPQDISPLLGKSTEFKTRCKKIIAVCNFILRNSGRQKSAQVLPVAEQTLDVRTDLVCEEIEELLEGRSQSIITAPDKPMTKQHGHYPKSFKNRVRSLLLTNVGRTWSFISLVDETLMSKVNELGNQLPPEKNHADLVSCQVRRWVNTQNERALLADLAEASVPPDVGDNEQFDDNIFVYGEGYGKDDVNEEAHSSDENCEEDKTFQKEHSPLEDKTLLILGNKDDVYLGHEHDSNGYSSSQVPLNINHSENIVHDDIIIAPDSSAHDYGNVLCDVGPVSSSSPSTITDQIAAFPRMGDFISGDFTSYMSLETQFHTWPSDVAFGFKKDEVATLDLDAVIEAPNLEQALIQLEIGLKKRRSASAAFQKQFEVELSEGRARENTIDSKTCIDNEIKYQASTERGGGCVIAEYMTDHTEEKYAILNEVWSDVDEVTHQMTYCFEGVQASTSKADDNVGGPGNRTTSCDDECEAEVYSHHSEQHSIGNPDIADFTSSSNEDEASPLPDGENISSDYWDSAYLSIDDLQNSVKTSPDNRLHDEAVINQGNKLQTESVGVVGESVGNIWREERNAAITGFMGPAEKEIWGYSDEEEEKEEGEEVEEEDMETSMMRYYPRILTPMLALMEPIFEEEEYPKPSQEIKLNQSDIQFEDTERLTPAEEMLKAQSNDQTSMSVNSNASQGEEPHALVGVLDVENKTKPFEDSKSIIVSDCKYLFTCDITDDSIRLFNEAAEDPVFKSNGGNSLKFEEEAIIYSCIAENDYNENGSLRDITLLCCENVSQGCKDMSAGIHKVNDIEEKVLQMPSEDSKSALMAEVEKNLTVKAANDGDETSEEIVVQAPSADDPIILETFTTIMTKKSTISERSSDTLKRVDGGFPSTMNVSLRKQYWDRKLLTLANESNKKHWEGSKTNNLSDTKSNNYEMKHSVEESKQQSKHCENSTSNIVKQRHVIFDTKSSISEAKKHKQSFDNCEVEQIEEVRIVSEKRRFWDEIGKDCVSEATRHVPRSPSLHHARRVTISEHVDADIYEANSNIPQRSSEEKDWKIDIQQQITSRNRINQRRSQQIISNTRRSPKIDKDEIRSRFEAAKHLFHALEQNKTIDPVSKCDLSKKRARRWRESTVQSAPSSDTETQAAVPKRVTIIGGSERIKVSERFHVRDLFRDVSGISGAGSCSFMKGIPHQDAVLMSLRSVDTERPRSPYENADYCCRNVGNELTELPHEATISPGPKVYQTEYPYLPETALRQFKPRSNLQGNTELIPRCKLLQMEQIYHV